ncbi:MAG: MMPL family transporter [Mariprofundaceae bacterium]|nr:MMPL family transporter [Mariprofundaceae bacterium]
MKRRLRRCAEFTCRYAAWVLIISAMLTGASIYFTATHLGFNTNTNAMLAADLPFRKAYQVFEQAFPQYLNNILIVIDGDTPETTRNAAKRLAESLEKNPQLFESVYLPHANRFLEKNALLYLTQDKLEDMSEKIAEIQPFLGTLSSDPSLRGLFSVLERAVNDHEHDIQTDIAPLLRQISTAIKKNMQQQRYLLSWQEAMQGNGKDSAARQQFIVVRPHMDFGALLAAKPAIQYIRTEIAELNLDANHGLNVRLTGSAALAYDELLSVSKGVKTAAILALIMVAVLLSLGLGSLRLVAMTLLCLIAGLSFSAAFATLVIGHLNLISVAFAVLYVGLGVDYAIHLCLRYRELLSKGVAPASAPWQAVQDVGGSLLLCALSTAIGFYCFVPTDYTGISELGIISGTSMFISLAITLILLPAMLCLWMKDTPPSPDPGRLAQGFTSFCQYVVQYRKSIRTGAFLLALGALFLLPQMRFDYDPINLRDPHSESVRTYKELIDRRSISPSSIMLLVGDREKAQELERRIKKLPSVDKTIALFDFIPRQQSEKLAIIDDMALLLAPQNTAILDTPPTAQQQLAAMQSLDKSLMQYLRNTSVAADNLFQAFQALHATLANFIDKLEQQNPQTQENTLLRLQKSLLGTLPASFASLHTALQVRAIDESDIPDSLRRRWLSNNGIWRIEVTAKENIRDIDALRRFVADVRSIAPNATGAPVFTLAAGDVVIHAFMQASMMALILIFLLLFVMLRSIKDAALVLFPLLLATALTGAAAVLLGIPLNFANVIALPLLLGIGVDNGIHMIQRYRQMQKRGKNTHQLLASSTAQAVVLSALTTILAFGNLAFSAHQGTAGMGQLLMLGVLFTMLCTLLVLPAFLNPTLNQPKTVEKEVKI